MRPSRMNAHGHTRRRPYPRIKQQTSANTTGSCLFQTDQHYTQCPLDEIHHCGIGKSTYAPKENASPLSTLACVIFEHSPRQLKLPHRALLLTVAWPRAAGAKVGVHKLDIRITQTCAFSCSGSRRTQTVTLSPACRAFDVPFHRPSLFPTTFSLRGLHGKPLCTRIILLLATETGLRATEIAIGRHIHRRWMDTARPR